MTKIMFSIIVVCFQAGEKLRQTVDSILTQSCLDYEIIIKDGMSSDGSLEKLPQSEKICIFSSKDAGIYDAMNQAVKEAEGDYLFFLNCGDSFYEADVLLKLKEFIKQTPGRGIYYGDTYNETTKSLVPVPKKITDFTCYRHIPCHQACIYERSLCTEKPYDLTYRIRADYDHFLWCYFKKGANPAHVGFSVANYEGGGFSESLQNQQRDQEEHREIVGNYMTRWQLFCYRFILLLTLAPLRKRIGNSRYLSKWYQGIKRCLYR